MVIGGWRASSIAALLSFISLFLVSCERISPPHLTTFSGVRMTVPYMILIGDSLSDVDRERIQLALEKVFSETNAIYNKWNPDSELSQLNQAKAYQRIKLSHELDRLLCLSGRMVGLTNGLFDPTVETVQELWKNSFQEGKFPDARSAEQLKGSLGWRNIHIEDAVFYKEYDETKIDLGGVAKGYAVDLMVELLTEIGIKNMLVNWGGDMRSTGIHPEGRPWRVYIPRFEDFQAEHAIDEIDLIDQSIATSGDYMQAWKVGDRTFTHVINPLSGKPLEVKDTSFGSVSVLAPSCAEADAIATALMLFDSQEQALQWMTPFQELNPEWKFWMISRNRS